MKVLSKNFGHSTLNGLQFKDIENINGKDQFVKLDKLNPVHGSEWQKKFDYEYSSVSESIASCVARHIQSPHRYADYKFDTFQLGKTELTGTTSDIYVKRHEVEKVLSIGKNGAAESVVAISLDDYADNIVDVKTEQRLNNLTELFEKNKVPKEIARDFLLEQAVFDTLLGNEDRLNNPSNFVLAYNKVTDVAVPVTMDYGRCLQMSSWSDMFEKNHGMYDDPEYESDIEFFTTNILDRNDAIIRGHNFQTSLDELKEHGAKPLQIDIDSVLSDIEDLKAQFKGLPFEKFATMKCEVLTNVMKVAQEHGLIENTNLIMTPNDLQTNEDEFMTIRKTGQGLTFLISDEPVMSLTINDKIITNIQVENEFIADIILPPEKRSYGGLERQLQHYMAQKKPLPELLDTIQTSGFSTPIHYNLDIELTNDLVQ